MIAFSMLLNLHKSGKLNKIKKGAFLWNLEIFQIYPHSKEIFFWTSNTWPFEMKTCKKNWAKFFIICMLHWTVGGFEPASFCKRQLARLPWGYFYVWHMLHVQGNVHGCPDRRNEFKFFFEKNGCVNPALSAIICLCHSAKLRRMSSSAIMLLLKLRWMDSFINRN